MIIKSGPVRSISGVQGWSKGEYSNVILGWDQSEPLPMLGACFQIEGDGAVVVMLPFLVELDRMLRTMRQTGESRVFGRNS